MIGCFTDDITILTDVVAALASRIFSNCDDLFEHGLRADGVYGIFVGENVIQTYCEFDRDGYNWMVRCKKKCLIK